MKINEIISSVDKDEIHDRFNTYFYPKTNKFTINDDGSLDVIGDVTFIGGLGIRKLPVVFNKITGFFRCHDKNLSSLENSPRIITKDFYCNSNQLTTLIGGPDQILGSFVCYKNKLETLEGFPKLILGNISIYNNQLTSLVGLPQTFNNDIILSYNNTLPLLRLLIAKRIEFLYTTIDINGDEVLKNDLQYIYKIEDVLNKYAGQGRKAALDCAADLLSLGKKLDIDLTMNARW